MLAASLLAAGGFYRVVTQKYGDNPAFQAIFANAVKVQIYGINLYANPPRGNVFLVALSNQLHPHQFQWFKATKQFRPDMIAQIPDSAFIVYDRDGSIHRLAYASGTLTCSDLPDETAPTGSATLDARFALWFESIKPHHKPPPYKRAISKNQSSTQSSRRPQ